LGTGARYPTRLANPQLTGRASLSAPYGLVYSAGALVCARRRPDPVPAVFGYHEVFHLLVIVGVAAHFLAISLFAVPIG
jgi:hemolysin III